ncbi:MAG: hypothetical protein D6772_15995 [Bacteroidetes bacterium]|nr:MAG: hypothetical protein D6772_15995 [Bacteroidota bacterium]
MRYFFLFLFILFMAAILHQFLPWYSIVLAGLAGGLLFPLPGSSKVFGMGFLAGLLLWGGYAAYLNALNEGILATRLGETFGGLSASMLVAVTGLLGAIYAGLGVWVGALGRRVWATQSGRGK